MVESLTTRYNKRLVAIITTNLSDIEMINSSGQRIFDRIVVMDKVIYFDGSTSHRSGIDYAKIKSN